MPRNASGVYTLPSGNPVVPGTTTDAAWANSTLEDIANELTNSLSRTGAGGMIAPFRIADGTVTAPGLSFLNETGSGLYRSGTGSVWMTIQGVNTAQFTTTGVNIPAGKSLAVAGNATVGGTLAVTGVLSSTAGIFNTTIDSITNKVGADHIHFKVKATQTLAKGDVVKVTGYNVGDAAFEVAKVSSATDVAIGIVYANIANGALGSIVNTGLLENLDTSAFSAGQILYPNTSGGLTTTKPSSGQYQAIAYVMRSNANNGAILIEASEPLYVQASTNTGNTLVLRDGSGNFSAGTVTANLTGNVTGNVTGNLTGNVTGNVSGNAGTVTNGVYTTGSYSNPSWLVDLAASKLTGQVAVANGGTGASTAANARVNLLPSYSGNALRFLRVNAGGTDVEWAAEPNVGTVTSVDVSGGSTGLSFTGGPITTSGTITMSGTLAVANGGTGATTASGARTALGLAIGTDVPSVTGTGASGTWGISITGNAATVTNGVVTTGSYSNPSWITSLAGSKISGDISGNAANVTGTVAVANGGTGATSAATARVNLLPSYTSNALKALRINAAGTDVEWFTVSTGGDVSGPSSAANNALVRFDGTTGKLIKDSSGLTYDGSTLVSTSSTAFYPQFVQRNTTSDANATYVVLDKARGSSVVQNGDVLGNLVFRGYDGSQYLQGAYINAVVSAAPGANDMPADLTLGTTPDGSAGPSERMRITQSGNVGIGTGSPGGKLDVAGSLGNVQINANGDQLAFTKNGFNYITASGASATLQIQASGAFGQLTFATNSAERLRIDSSGNLGLGVTPGAWTTYKAFDIGGAQSIATYQDGATNTIGFVANALWNGSWVYRQSSVGASRYALVKNAHQWFTAPSGTAGNAISFTQALTLNTNGALVLQGGNTSANGVGITFPATQSASSDVNTLDDYEEGTWTPSVTFSTSNGDVAYSARYGRYTKVGRIVTCTGYMWFSESTASGNFSVSGLPFTSSSGGQYGYTWYGTIFVEATLSGYTNYFMGVDGNTTSAAVYGNAGTRLTNANTGANTVFRFSVTYESDA